ncbi:riboflavin synthase [Klugiella xanthotipulae]|uniref:Riboflavin synthase n=1 Tax=Klugiella xanthotipulae TaxID=244735 RepID=A0A543HYP3_9MICO|nr:riboflavin synthase [Klugiella xanthotipulae]TQM63464.1 riboflavin synthase alpha chain [Klugiella xanthotipulae]
MFTGLIEEVGHITAVESVGDSLRLTVSARTVLDGVRHGDSIAVSGVCLTVVDHNDTQFTADVMAQTLTMSTLREVAPGRPVNLERAAALGDRLGGHIVQGHVDGTATVLTVTPADAWRVLRFSLPREQAPLVVDKGSLTVDGVSLTVSRVSPASEPEQWCEVSLIPETLTATTLGTRTVGDSVNIETDILARHILRAAAFATLTTSPATEPEPEPTALPLPTPEGSR